MVVQVRTLLLLTCWACAGCGSRTESLPASHEAPRPDGGAVVAGGDDARPTTDGGSHPARFVAWQTCEEFPAGLAQFETVFWEPGDTQSLRQLIRETDLVRGKRILEIGTGTGLVALCCLRAGAESVVATDINPHAIACARYNASRFPFGSALETRLVSSDNATAFAVIGEGEAFDLIISNPPWEDGRVESVDQYALYDENFALLKSLLVGLHEHLNPDGQVLLAFGCVTAIRLIQEVAPTHRLRVTVLDERNLEDLDEVFLPGMLLQLVPE